MQRIEFGMEKIASGGGIGEAAIRQYGGYEWRDAKTLLKRDSGVFGNAGEQPTRSGTDPARGANGMGHQLFEKYPPMEPSSASSSSPDAASSSPNISLSAAYQSVCDSYK